MTLTPSQCCVLNAGPGAWAFEELAARLSAVLWVDVATEPRRYNYLLHAEGPDVAGLGELFIPFESIQVAADKRRLAEVFAQDGVPTPATFLVRTLEEAREVARRNTDREWCLKYPLGCGGAGHRLLTDDLKLPKDWPTPLVLQEFIRLDRPEVYRTYCAGNEGFGWVVRRFPAGARPSPWVAHARGARYENLGPPPADAARAAAAALRAAGLWDAFGCADLLRRPSGEWLVLEVGTDGLYNHVDRDVGDAALAREIDGRLAAAFWSRAGTPPWAPGAWRPVPGPP